MYLCIDTYVYHLYVYHLFIYVYHLFLMELSLTQWLDIEVTSLKYKGWRWLTGSEKWIKNFLGSACLVSCKL